MEINWTFAQHDIDSVRSIVNQYSSHPMVNDRVARNLADVRPPVARDRFWRAMVASLLTTQQRSGPDSAVARFINTKPFPLGYEMSLGRKQPRKYFADVLSRFGGIRRYDRIAEELTEDLTRLEGGLWGEIATVTETLRSSFNRPTEVAASDFIDEKLVGFGPKQARNLLQGLGLTRYEIPIDSRITRWLNDLGFPLHLSAAGLADRDYYKFVMEGVFQLCQASGVYPCIFDAAVFSSFDGDGWTAENVGW